MDFGSFFGKAPMKKFVRSAVAAAILAAIVLSCMSGAYAVNVTDLGTRLYSRNTNNSYNAFPGLTVRDTADSSAAADYTVSDYQSLVKTVEHQYILRNPSFTVRYNASADDLKAAGDKVLNDIFTYDDPATTSDLDYLGWNMDEWGYKGYIYTLGSEAYAIYTFSQTYRTTAAQEDYVNNSVSAILQKLDVGSGSSAYAKIKAVQNYILKNVSYDYSLTKFTAYDALSSGLAVCQGYTLLAYKMLSELGVPVKFIGGTTTQSTAGHAWNIVKIGQYWYNLDVTWDDTVNPEMYFLKSNASFSDHIRDSEFATPAFNTAYPMAPDDYNPSSGIQAITFAQKDAFCNVGDSFIINAVVEPSNAANQVLTWTSSDPNVASVDTMGKVTVNNAGTAIITASAADGSGASGSYTVTAAIADVPSGWAKIGVDALTLRGVIPAALLSGYQISITRAEFTALIVNVYEYVKGPYNQQMTSPFTDTADSNYVEQISKGYELGIVDGTSASSFSPDGTLTREQCAKIISAAVSAINGSPVSSAAALLFGDTARIDSWALDYVRYAYENSLMTGTGVNFEPLGILTREQAMLIAERMIEKYNWQKT
jgi:uncharacterized protein YjdB